jgi:hypothetical protein
VSFGKQDRITYACPNCGAQFHEPGQFCSVCGTPTNSLAVQRHSQPPALPQHVSFSADGVHPTAARGFAQLFGLHTAVAALTITMDVMLHTAVIVTAGLLIPFSAAAGVVLGIITFIAQRKWYGDDRDSALIKALIVGILTAVPSPLPYMLFVPAGIVGFFRNRKSPNV